MLLKNKKKQNELIHNNLILKINNYHLVSEEMKDKAIEMLKKQNEILKK